MHRREMVDRDVDPMMPFDAAFTADPRAGWDRLRAAGAVHRIRTPEGPTAWLVTRYAEVQAALLDPRLSVAKTDARGDDFKGFTLPPELDAHLLNREGADHARLRRLVAPAMSQHRIDSLRTGISRRCEELLADLARPSGQHRPVDLVARLAIPFPLAVVCDLLGVPERERSALQEWARHLLAPEPADVPRARDTLTRMSEIVTDLIAAKRADPGDDLLSALIVAGGDGDRLSQDELTAMTFYLLFVWYEVSVDLLANGLLTLLLHPGRIEDLRTRPEQLPGAVEELLRHETPQALAAPRYPREDLHIGGQLIPAGDTVLLALAAANRDPQRFAGPDTFDLERTANPHLSFGAGIHRCLGASLVRLQTEIVLTQILDRFPQLTLAVGPDHLRWREGLRHRGVRELPVTY